MYNDILAPYFSLMEGIREYYMKSLNKDELIEILASKKGFTKEDCRTLIDGLIEIFEQSAKSGTEISVRGFGKLVFSTLPARKGYNKQTGEMIDLPPKTKIHFKLAENIRFADQDY